jgi:hypothetical protein
MPTYEEGGAQFNPTSDASVGKQPEEWMIIKALSHGRVSKEEAADLDPKNFGHLLDNSKVKEIKIKGNK